MNIAEYKKPMDHIFANRRLTASVRIALLCALLMGVNIYYTHSVLGKASEGVMPEAVGDPEKLVDSLQRLETIHLELTNASSKLETDTVSLLNQQATLETTIETLNKEIEELERDKINGVILRNTGH